MGVQTTDSGQRRADTVLDLIGNTPLIRLSKFETGLNGVELYGKAEWFNPGGSVKDRPAANMVREGLRSGALRPGKTLLDATSGNTGIAYAMIGASQGFPVKLCVPSNVTVERKRLLHAYGAELIFTDPMDGSDGAIREARKQVAADPDAYFYPDQYNNDANWRAHYEDDRAGDSCADRWAHHALRRRSRHERHVHGHRPPPPRSEPVDQADFVSTRLAAAWPRRSQAHGDRDRARHLRPVAGRRGHARQHRGRVYDGAAAGERGRAAGGHLGRRRAGRAR